MDMDAISEMLTKEFTYPPSPNEHPLFNEIRNVAVQGADRGIAGIHAQWRTAHPQTWWTVAVEAGYGIALTLLDIGASPERLDRQERNALHIALNNDTPPSLSLIDALLSKGVNVNAQDNKGDTPLLITKLWPKIAERLLAAGVRPDIQNYNGATWLFRNIQHADKLGIEDLRSCLDMGSPAKVLDIRGRSILFPFMRSDIKKGEPVWRALLELGLSPRSRDYNGNTLLHELMAVPFQEKALSWVTYLTKYGLSLNEPNNQGRIPLHILCSQGHMGTFETTGRSAELLSHVLKGTVSVDARDHKGVTPLMLACTHSEDIAQKLLAAGADVTAASHEGLTSMHTSKRARQSNIIGMLLTHLKKSVSTQTMRQILDARDAAGRTPLHHACRSGRSQSVAMLLRAGASTDLRDYKSMTPADACVEYEAEDILWDGYREIDAEEAEELRYEGRTDLLGQHHVGISLSLSESVRPLVDAGKWITETTKRTEGYGNMTDCQHDTGLADTLTMLDPRPLERKSCWSKRLAQSAACGHFYTVQALSDHLCENDDQQGEVLHDALSIAMHISFGIAQYRRSLTDALVKASDAEIVRLFPMLLRIRQFREIEKICQQRPGILMGVPVYGGEMNIHLLIRHGFHRTLRTIAPGLATSKHNDQGWHRRNDPSTPGFSRCTHDPAWQGSGLLLAACERVLTNMETVQLLVEDLGVDLNEIHDVPTHYEGDCIDNTYRWFPEEREVVRSPSPLHHLAAGRHWWHAYEALPYLLQNPDINIDVRDKLGQTPLYVAALSEATFARESIRLLIEHGADPTAIDADGQTCVELAAWRTDLRGLLVH